MRWGISLAGYPITLRQITTRYRCLPTGVTGSTSFEWKAIKAQKAKQPYAIDMTDRRSSGMTEAH